MPPAGIQFVFSGLFSEAPRALGADGDLSGHLRPVAPGVVRTDELPAAPLLLPAGEHFGARRVRDPARLYSYSVGGRMRGRGFTTDFASVHSFSRGWREKHLAGGLMSGRARDGFRK